MLFSRPSLGHDPYAPVALPRLPTTDRGAGEDGSARGVPLRVCRSADRAADRSAAGATHLSPRRGICPVDGKGKNFRSRAVYT